MNKQPVSYLQTDPRWAKVSYSVPGESTTIGKSGCGPTSAAMILATWADQSVTPLTECAWALAHGYKALKSGTYYGYFVPAFKRYGLTCRQLNGASIYGNAGSPHHATVQQELQKGNLVVACMGKGNWTSSGHYVVPWKQEGDTIYINDPASTKARRTAGSWALFKQQVKYYWVIERPATAKEEDDMTQAQTEALVDKKLAEWAEQTSPVYNSLAEVPDWARPTIEKLINKGLINGALDGQLNLSYDLTRVFVVNDRAGLYN